MKFLRDDEMPAAGTVESYQETKWSGLVVGSVLLAAAVAVIVWPLHGGALETPWVFWMVIPAALVILMIARYAFRTFTASRRDDGWRLCWSADGLYIRYRSYLNNRFATDTPTVLFLTRREVAWLKARGDTLATPDEKGNWTLTRRHGWLEIGLKDGDVAPIKAALADEAKRRTPSGARVNDTPLTVTPDGTLRVALARPGAVTHTLRLAYNLALPEETRSGDFAAMTQAEKEDHVRLLAAAGDSFAAIKAAREVYGMDLTQAKAFVDDLQGRG